ncbi:MAG: lactonase family protein [Planctomycetes bacterium]|nr:lactonase family protein [Planctomycetota bacterium]
MAARSLLSPLRPILPAGLLPALALSGCGSADTPVAAPSALSYSSTFELATKGEDLAPLLASVRGGAVSSWSVTPALPAGLELDASDGSIGGVPRVQAEPATYVVRASNVSGFSEASVVLGVVAPLQLVAVANSADSTLSAFRIDPGTGLLTPTGITAPIMVESGARGICAHPSGNYLYLLQRDSSTVRIFDVHADSGRFVERGAVACAGLNPNELTLSPDGSRLYVIAQTQVHVETFTVGGDGSLSSLGGLSLDDGIDPIDGAWDAELAADGRFLWLSNVTAKSIQTLALDPTTGLPAVSGPPSVSNFTPFWLASSRDGRFLYTNCRIHSRLQVYSIDPQTGALSFVENENTALQPSRVALAPSGRFLYATIASDDTLRTFAIDPSTGALSLNDVTPTGDRPESLSFDFTGERVYVTLGQDAELQCFRVDPATGELTLEDSLRTRESPLNIAPIPSDEPPNPRASFAYVSTSEALAPTVFRIDSVDGALAPLSTPAPGAPQPQAVALHPSARWLVSARPNDNQLAVLALDPATGLPTAPEALTASAAEPIALAFEPSGRRLLVLHRLAGELRLLDFDESTGDLAQLGALSVSAGARSLAVDSSGRFAYVANPETNEVLTVAIDLATGALTQSQPAKPLDGQPAAVAITPNGRYLLASAASKGRVALYQIHAADGALSLISSRPSGTNTVALTSDPLGRFIYVCNRDTNGVGDVSVFRIDPNSIITDFTRVGEFTAGNQPIAASVHPSGSQLYVASEGSNTLVRLLIDRSSGMPQPVQSTSLTSAPQGIALSLRLVP